MMLTKQKGCALASIALGAFVVFFCIKAYIITGNPYILIAAFAVVVGVIRGMTARYDRYI